jgi:hypothetical protein
MYSVLCTGVHHTLNAQYILLLDINVLAWVVEYSPGSCGVQHEALST